MTIIQQMINKYNPITLEDKKECSQRSFARSGFGRAFEN